MKKLYLALLTAVIAAAFGFTSSAQEYSITINWDAPGTVKIAINNVFQDIPEGATTFTAKTDTWYSAQIYGTDGYIVSTCTADDGSIISRSTTYSTPPELRFQIPIKNNHGKIYTVTTEKLVNDRKFKLNVVNGADKIKQLTVGNLAISSFGTGENEYSFSSIFGTSCSFSVENGVSPYSVTLNGNTVTPFYGQYRNIALTGDSDVLTIQVYEEGKEPVVEKCTVTLALQGAASQAVKNIFNNTKLKAVDFAGNSFEVEKGDKLTFNFSEDYDITTFTAGSEAISINGTQGSFTVSEDLTVTVNASEKAYKTEMFTAYIVCPEALDIYAGNAIRGEKLELTGGATVSGAIALPATTNEKAYTIPAGAALRFDLPVSTKYGSVNVTTKEGYWIRTKRLGDKKETADNPITDKTFYIVAEPVEHDASAIVYLSGDKDRITLSPNSVYGAGDRRGLSNEGYSVFTFDNDYESPFSIRTGELIDGMKVNLDGVALSADENGVYSAALKDGSRLEILANPAKQHTLTINKGFKTDASLTFDSAPIAASLPATENCYAGTVVTLKPTADTKISLDGAPLTPDADGNCKFTVSGNHSVELAYTGKIYTFLPDPSEPAESLDEILVSFPAGITVTRGEFADDEISFRSSDETWASPSLTVTEVTGAATPTYAIRCSIAPVKQTSYVLTIPEGFFMLDGSEAPQATETFTLKKTNADLSYTVLPEGKLTHDLSYSMVGVMFAESHNGAITIANGSAISLKLDDTEIESGFSRFVSENMFIIQFNDGFDAGDAKKLTLSLGAGALSLSGTASPTIEHSWDFIADKDYTWSISPEGGEESAPTVVSSLDEITIVFDNAETATVDYEYGARMKNFDSNAYYSEVANITAVAGAEHPTFRLTFSKKAEALGKYELSLYSGTFKLDGAKYSPAINLFYTLTTSTGIESVTVEEGTTTIYSLQGILIDAEWESLPAGVYIVNGKKVKK